MTDTNGLVVAEYEYDPFGEITETSGLASVTPFRFAAYYLDATGLYKAGERYYDPAFGRWTQQDPIHSLFDPKLRNRYVYVGNDPVNDTDPSGLSWYNPASWNWGRVGCTANKLFNPFGGWDAESQLFESGLSIAGAGTGAIAYWGAVTVAEGAAAAGSLGAVIAAAAPLVVAGVAIAGYGAYRAWKSCG